MCNFDANKRPDSAEMFAMLVAVAPVVLAITLPKPVVFLKVNAVFLTGKTFAGDVKNKTFNFFDIRN